MTFASKNSDVWCITIFSYTLITLVFYIYLFKIVSKDNILHSLLLQIYFFIYLWIIYKFLPTKKFMFFV